MLIVHTHKINTQFKRNTVAKHNDKHDFNEDMLMFTMAQMENQNVWVVGLYNQII
jgi:hypothetical protein